ncbi:hypothetical protein MYTO111405_00790 [Mycoplasma todarodis]
MEINKTKYDAIISKEETTIIGLLNYIIDKKLETSILDSFTFADDLSDQETQALKLFIEKIALEFTKYDLSKIELSQKVDKSAGLEEYISTNATD